MPTLKKITALPFFFALLVTSLQAQIETQLFENVDPKSTLSKVFTNEEKTSFTFPYTAKIRDVLGTSFQTEEDLHVRIGSAELKYNLNLSKRSTQLTFGAAKPGYFPYKIYGSFRHLDGYRYEVSGTGMIFIGGGERLDLYLGSIDKVRKTATVYLQ